MTGLIMHLLPEEEADQEDDTASCLPSIRSNSEICQRSHLQIVTLVTPDAVLWCTATAAGSAKSC